MFNLNTVCHHRHHPPVPTFRTLTGTENRPTVKGRKREATKASIRVGVPGNDDENSREAPRFPTPLSAGDGSISTTAVNAEFAATEAGDKTIGEAEGIRDLLVWTMPVTATCRSGSITEDKKTR
jgi:hypothetical protein